MRRLSLLFVVAIALGCRGTQSVSAPAPTEGKPQAPVAVSAELGDSGGRVSVRFEADATGVEVGLSGLEGLEVLSPPAPIVELTAARGQTRSLDVRYRPGPGRSSLVVTVTGQFGGARSMRVVSFDVGRPTGEQQRTPGVVTQSGADLVKVMPVDGG